MRISSLSEYPFTFKPASLCKLYLVSPRRYIRLLSSSPLRLSSLQQSNDALSSLLHTVVKLLSRLIFRGAQPQGNFFPRIAQLACLPDLFCPGVHSLCNLSDRDRSFQLLDPSRVLSALDTLKIDAGRNKLNPLRMFLFLLYRSVEAVNEGQEKVGLQICYGLAGICISSTRF